MEIIRKKTINIVYTHFPHYRHAVFTELSKSNKYNFTFFFDKNLNMSGIKEGLADDLEDFCNIRTYQFKSFMFQPYIIYNSLFTKSDMVIYLGNPFILSNWIAMIILRFRKKKSMLWTHGWIKKDKFPIRIIRNYFYSLSDGLLLYGNKAYAIGKSYGFTESFMHVIYNSLDYQSQRIAMENYRADKKKNSDIKRPSYFLVVGRLVNSLEIDILIDALAISKNKINVKVVGDGPEKNRLIERVQEKGVNVEFMGPIYDEENLCKIFLDSVAVISPGKVGLLTMHALGYGIPVITHSNHSAQMPEFEALQPDLTGFFFNHGSPDDLFRVINYVENHMSVPENRKKTAQSAINAIEERYTPSKQLKFIEKAISSIKI